MVFLPIEGQGKKPKYLVIKKNIMKTSNWNGFSPSPSVSLCADNFLRKIYSNIRQNDDGGTLIKTKTPKSLKILSRFGICITIKKFRTMKKLILNLLSISMMVLVSFTSCDNLKTDNAEAEFEETTEATKKIIQEEKDRLSKDLITLQHRVDIKLQSLRNELETASEDTKAELNQQIKDWEIKRKQIGTYFDQIGDDLDKSWVDFKEQVRAAMNELDRTLDENTAKDKEEQ